MWLFILQTILQFQFLQDDEENDGSNNVISVANPDRNDSAVSQANGSSSETEYLENLTQEYERTEKERPPPPPIFSEKLQNVNPDLIWGIYRTEKYDLVMDDVFPPESIEGS